MTIVERALERCGSTGGLADRLTEITGHTYRTSHIAYWLKIGHFPPDLANVVASEIFSGEITAYEACPKIKRVVA